MTSTPSATRPFRAADLGTLVVVPWSGEAPDGRDMPYLLACSLGDAADGDAETTAAAIERLLTDNGLPVGGDLVDGTQRPSLPVTLLVESGAAVLHMPTHNAQCVPTPEWLAAVAQRGYAYLVFTTRPWPEVVPGRPIEPEALAEFAGADDTLRAAAHIVLPARSLRG
ncbi:DUF5949 family protein [Streptomyces sp. NPDC002588]|uniref:DUF5949 family protein n=1 Tax=Streptomyces sp. NPDC002588 TaxID=3154419 RepID=UPI003326BF4E